MKNLVKISDIFEVKYGVNLELNKLTLDPNGINFVSRTMKNNGVSAKVKPIKDLAPLEAGLLTVAGGGSVLETFVQPEPFYSGRDLYYLRPKTELSLAQKIYYCICIRSNKYRFNYGRQANRTLGDLLVPSPDSIPQYVDDAEIDATGTLAKPASDIPLSDLGVGDWKYFSYEELFDIKKGKRLTKKNMRPGDTPFIGSSDANNGLTAKVGQTFIHTGNTISVCYNGSVAEAFYQANDYWASDDVNVLYPKFELNVYIALFITTLIRQEKYRYNYGRKWHLQRMNKSLIKLPVLKDGTPDFTFMEAYIKSVPYSAAITA